MISIATGSNILDPGPRIWLAGCPWVSANEWSQESNTPQPPTRETFTARGAFWRAAKNRDLGNAQTVWSFTSHIQFASFQASAAFVAGLTDAGLWQGILEWWVADAAFPGTYNVYRAAGCCVQCSLLEVANVGITVGYRATFGIFTYCGSETVYPDVLGDGLGGVLGEWASTDTENAHHVLTMKTCGRPLAELADPPPDDGGDGGDGEGGGGGGGPPAPEPDRLGTGSGDDALGIGSGDDVLGTQP